MNEQAFRSLFWRCQANRGADKSGFCRRGEEQEEKWEERNVRVPQRCAAYGDFAPAGCRLVQL